MTTRSRLVPLAILVLALAGCQQRGAAPRRVRRSRIGQPIRRADGVPERGRVPDGLQRGQSGRSPAAQGLGNRFCDGRVSRNARDVRAGGAARSVALAGQPAEAGGARPLARCQALLQRALAAGGARAVLQREDARLGLRLLGRRLSPAHRGRMGIRRPRRAEPGPTISDRPETCGSTPGSATTPIARRMRWARRNPTPGGCTTCTATCRSGARTPTTRATTGSARRPIPTGRPPPAAT